MTHKRLRWGVISTANIGRFAVIPAIQASHNSELVAVASRDVHKSAEFAARLNIPQSYGRYQSLLDASDIDAVYIPLPNSLHREWTIMAAEAGKHILCEKPLAMSAAECADMQAAAQANGVKLMEAFMYRFHPQMEKVLERVRSGALGTLRVIHASFTFRLTNPANIRLQPELGGGALMDVGCYCVNLSRTVAGAEPVQVQAFARWGVTGVDEEMIGSLLFADGPMAQFDCALTLARRESCQIVGTDAYVDMPATFLPGDSDTTILESRGAREPPTAHVVGGVNEYQLMVEHFADCVLNDRPLRYGPEEAAANMRVIEALYRSARRGGLPENL
jgi:D-xylose 1-dehydrogenase (NADP+, D-xylono-1,5-lactone-forming)